MTIAAEPIIDRVAAEPEVPRTARITKAEYLRMVEAGVFDGRRGKLFLFRGELIEVPSMGWEHWHGLQRTTKWAFKALGGRFEIAAQVPIDAPEDSMPEPDVAVYDAAEVLRKPCPDRAELLIEVADSSIRLDRAMTHEYSARAREFWILDVRRRVLHVYRNPHDDPAGLYGKAFDAPLTVAEADSIAPQCDPAASVVVRDLLPPASAT